MCILWDRMSNSGYHTETEEHRRVAAECFHKYTDTLHFEFAASGRVIGADVKVLRKFNKSRF